MYLLPLLSENNAFVKKTVTQKTTVMTHQAMFALAGYMHLSGGNYVGILPYDPCQDPLDVYDPPPNTDILMERILQAVGLRSEKDIESGHYTKRLKGYRACAITTQEWKA